MTNISYGTLKSNIIKACSQVSPCHMAFKVDFRKLTDLVEDNNIKPINIGMNSSRIEPNIIPYISEYFEKTHLSWFSEGKYYTVITFIDTTSIDNRARDLIEKINIPQERDPDIDKVNAYATLIAEYPCYFATIVSYQNNNPKRIGKPSYEIVCRANKVVIKSSDYQYNPKDFS